MLGNPERRLLNRLSVFRGGWELEAIGEAQETKQRHSGYFLALAERAEPAADGTKSGCVDRRAGPGARQSAGRPGVVAGLGEADSAGRLSWALWDFWRMRNDESEARRWAEQILETGTGLSTRGRARALCIRSVMDMGQGDFARAESRVIESYQTLKAQGDTLAAARDEGRAMMLEQVVEFWGVGLMASQRDSQKKKFP